MPDTELRIRLVTLNEALDDLDCNPRPFLLVNVEQHPGGIPMPNKLLLERLREDGADDLLIVPTRLAELGAILPLGRDRDHFIAGEFVLMKVTKLHETPERPHGGQDVFGLEKRARDGLYVTVTMATERLRACDDYKEGRKMATETRRGEIFERLQPLLGNISVRNCFAEGQKRVEVWYPGLTSYQAMKSVYVSAREALHNGAKPASLEADQLELVRTAHAIYTKTEELLKAQHAMSAELRKMMESDQFAKANPEQRHQMQARFLREQARPQHQDLAHNRQGGPSLPQLMRVAAAMDLNPSSVYANLLFYKTELDCAMLLGRAERGIGAMLGPKHVKRLRLSLAQTDGPDDNAGINVKAEAASALRDVALRVKTSAGWEEFFAIAEQNSREFWITKAL
jgi:hypothetical protein